MSTSAMEVGENPEDDNMAEPLEEVGKPPSYLLELSKSDRSECRRCGEKISGKEVRVGIVFEGNSV